MKTVVKPKTLQILEQNLQRYLQEVGFKDLPLQISCTFLEDTLMVVGEHPSTLKLKVEPTLSTLQEAVLACKPQSVQQIGLCLKVTGQKQPYAFHSFSLESLLRPKISLAEVQETQVRAAEKPVTASVNDSLESQENLALSEDSPSLDELTPHPSVDSVAAELAMFSKTSQSEWTDNPFDPEEIEATSVDRKPISLLTLALVAGAGAASILLFSLIYALTRPCVIGECTAIPEAKQLSQEAVMTLKLAKTGNTPIEAQQHLQQAIAELEAIPFWSFRYWEAQQLLKTYRQKSIGLEPAITAVRQANAAALKSQNPPHTAEDWREVQGLWQNAIATLEPTRKDSPVYPFAQKKLKEYQTNLATASKRLTIEQQAEGKLDVAKDAAQISEAREGVAQLPETWQKVQSGWEISVNALAGIPAGTTAYEQAKVLLPKYEQKLAQARDRKTLEGIAEETYTEAVTSAAQARIFAQRDGWFQATEYWRKAIQNAEQVPVTSAYYSKIQPLIASYKTSLQEAEAQLRIERLLQKARKELDKVCKGSPRVCDYTVSQDLMTIQLTPAYVQKIYKTYLKAGDRDPKTRQGVEKHIQTLQVALEAISNNAGVPLKLYDADGKRIGTHSPDR